MKGIILLILLVFYPLSALCAEAPNVPLEQPNIDYSNQASLQRGAKLYINYCLGCHSLAYLRYNRLAEGTGIVDDAGKVADRLVKQNLIFSDAKISDAILSAMPELEAEKWFGKAPPDLTLVVKVKGADWVYTYLKSFYEDPSRPFGVNNLVFPDVAMPNVLGLLQGKQVPIYETKVIMEDGKLKEDRVIAHLALESKGTMTEAEFNSAINDIVNFLAFASRPEQATRHYIGYWVIGFLIVFAILAYLLKSEYWKDIDNEGSVNDESK